MQKTQAELDAAVIEAAEQYLKGFEPGSVDGMALANAVRARREAMAPKPAHKAALLAFIERHTSDYVAAGFDYAVAEWIRLSERDRSYYRAMLAKILAAPDEPCTEVAGSLAAPDEPTP